MIRGTFQVHRDAAGTRTRKASERKVFAVETTTVNPQVWAMVRHLQRKHGYTSIEVISETEVRLK